MITWPKLIGSALFMLPNIIAFFLDCCGPSPRIDSVTPDIGSRGTDVRLTITGVHFTGCNQTPPTFVVDYPSVGDPSVPSISFDPNVDPWSDTSVPVTLHIPANATRGVHYIYLDTGHGHAVGAFFVTCVGCPPPPRLLGIYSETGAALVPGDPTVTFRFVGKNLSSNNLEVHGDNTFLTGVSWGPGPYSVQSSGGVDYFLVPITAAPNARDSEIPFWVITDGGTSNAQWVFVDASQPPPSPAPGGPPVLNGITPMLITQAAGSVSGTVAVKCEGSGFGTEPQIVVDQNNTIGLFAELQTYQANPDQVVVGLTQPLPGGTDTSVTVRVQNTQTGMTSNAQILHLDPPNLGAPFVQDPGGFFVTRNGDADFTMFGQNLQGVTDQSFSGIPGVTFSNVQPDPNPNYPPGTAIDFHVHADGSAPVTYDEATNLIITTTNGHSNPIVLEILPQ